MHVQVRPTLAWIANGAAFAAAIPLVMLAAFVAQVPFSFSDSVALFFYDAAFAVFPTGCPVEIPYHNCVALGGWYSYWSIPVWAVTALVYGRFVRGRPLRQKLIVAALVIPGVILLMQLAMPLWGWRHFIDTL